MYSYVSCISFFVTKEDRNIEMFYQEIEQFLCCDNKAQANLNRVYIHVHVELN